MENKFSRSNQKGQKGAIVVEACISLPVFMFAIFILLYIEQIAYTQARIALAIDSATKELSQYSHVLYMANIPQTFNGQNGSSSEIVNKVAEFFQNIGDALGTVDTNLGSTVTTAADKMAGDSVSAYLLQIVGTGGAKLLAEKNMVDWEGDTAKAFYARHRVKDVSYVQSKFAENGSKDVAIKITYKIKMVQLLGLEYDFQMAHCAYTQAWAGG